MFVLGMHRSGTSSLARVLNLLGVDLGNRLVPPQPGNNASGFWESRLIGALHKRALAALGYSWFNVRALPAGWTSQGRLPGIAAALAETARGQFADSPLWGVKDPRLCRLFPLWRTVIAQLDCEPHCVLIVRDPDDVARSLHARDGMLAGRSHLLWLRHVTEAEAASRGMARVFVGFDELIADWRAAVARIEREFGWQFGHAAAAAAEVDAFLEAGRAVAGRGTAALVPAAASLPWVADVYDACRRACRGADITADAGYRAAVDALAAADPVFDPLLAELARRSDSRFVSIR